LRVLDMAHVLAGPICSRVLAEQGADVLHVSSPHDRDASYIELDTMFGKRASYIDLNRASDETRLWDLIRSCDVFAHSWRPGSLERRGLSMERMAACRPGIIFVSVSCYGYGGPWMTRGGYEPLGQTACGLVLDEGTMDEPLLAPNYTLNDYLAGYLAAAGVLGALIRRAHEGGSYHVHVSLTRCSMWCKNLGCLNKASGRHVKRVRSYKAPGSDLMSTETVFGMVDHAALSLTITLALGPGRQSARRIQARLPR
jgi:crotonobetainyl-CoA:carnitine CoA-transferase CaiB-like acyl-CoA transferase